MEPAGADFKRVPADGAGHALLAGNLSRARSHIDVANDDNSQSWLRRLRELFDAGIPSEELIDAIACGKLGSVIAGRDHESTLVSRSELLAWLGEKRDAQWANGLRLPDIT